MAKKYLYCRVSTKRQLKDGNSLEDQAAKLLEKYPDGIVVIEQYSGAKTDRPKFQEVLSLVKPGDTIAVTKLDRLSRNLEEGIHVINSLRDKGVIIDILNMGIIENSLVGNLIVQILLAFAEFERASIIERTQSGREYARENKQGYKEGRKTKITPALEKLVLNLVSQGCSYRQIQEEYNINRGIVYKIVQMQRERQLDIK